MFGSVRHDAGARRGARLSWSQVLSVAFFAITLQLGAEPAWAQTSCSVSDLTAPSRRLLDCGGGFRIEFEPSVRIKASARAGERPPRAVTLLGGAALIEVVPGSLATQIRTPHAIAAVRGTVYAIEVLPDMTSVLVVQGSVEVRKTTGEAESVRLGPGQGVDVSAETPLTVKTWPAARVARLLARLGR
jgi:ferric-dicitrate binding protein FerR (iron transport regulator)